MKKDYLKYFIFAAAIFCMPLFLDVFAKTPLHDLRVSGNYYNSSGTAVKSFDFYTYTTIPANTFPQINGFVPLFDGIPQEFILSANKTTYFHLHFGTNVAIDRSKFGNFLKGLDVYSSMGDLLTLKLVHANYSINDPIIYYDFYIKYTCPSSYSECRIGNSNFSIINTFQGVFTDNPYYLIWDIDRYFGTILDGSYVETVSESDVNNIINSSNNKEIVDALGRIDISISKVDSTLNDIKDMDLPDDKKDLPDDSAFNDYENAEKDLLDKVNQIDLDSIDIGIDTNSSNFVWDTTTRLIKSHPAVFGMFISILSIGIIKLALGR